MKTLLRDIRKAGARVYVDGDVVRLEGGDADLCARLTEASAELLAELTPNLDHDSEVHTAKLVAELAGDVSLIHSQVEAEQAIGDLCAAQLPIAVDVETAVRDEYKGPVPVLITAAGTLAKRQSPEALRALDPRYSRIRLVQLSIGTRTVVIDMNTMSVSVLAPLFASGGPTIVGHNFTFDAQFILAGGVSIDPDIEIWDTLLAQRHIDGTLPKLEVAVKKMLDVDLVKTLGASDWSGDLTAGQLNYAALDAAIEHRLYLAQLEVLEKAREQDPDDRRLASHALTCSAIVGTAQMMVNGVWFDLDEHAKEVANWERKVAEASTALEMATKGHPMDTDENASGPISNRSLMVPPWPNGTRSKRRGALTAS